MIGQNPEERRQFEQLRVDLSAVVNVTRAIPPSARPLGILCYVNAVPSLYPGEKREAVEAVFGLLTELVKRKALRITSITDSRRRYTVVLRCGVEVLIVPNLEITSQSHLGTD